MNSNFIEEPLLQDSTHRFVLFPIEMNDVWQMYKKAISAFWTPEEIDFSRDHHDWNDKLNDNERHFIKHILAFFAGSDGIVMENLAVRFLKEITIPEVRHFYSFQIFNEGQHSEMYSLLIDTYVKDQKEKDHLLQAIETIPAVQKKAEWALKWIDGENHDAPFAQRLLAFAIIEGVFFSGSFCSIYWIKNRGLMPGLTFSNELISKDEGMHCEFAILLYSKLKNKLSQEIVHLMFKNAVEIEKEFISISLPVELIGMNSNLMKEYIEFVADRLLKQLDYEPLFKTKNPFDFMEMISLRPKANFFEIRVGEYQKTGVGKKENEKDIFQMNEDF